jgi:glutamine synthetase
MMDWPVVCEPVKATFSTPGCEASAAPAVSPKPGATLTTPGGLPASITSSASRSEVSGASSAGFRITVQPVAIAGPHVHQSLWKGETNLFYDKADYAELSELGRYYIGGLLTHAWALCGLCAPTTNSYRRLVPGYEAPINLVYSQRNRSACCRIPMYSPNPRAKRVEFRSPDPSCNPYLAFAAMLMAGLDGINNRIDPGSPNKNLYDLPPAEAKEVKSTPGSLDQALDALERDHAFLLRGDVFTSDVIETWLDYKRKREVDAIRLRPHPHEFHLYYDI